jgi:hypothetical protein
MLTRRFLLAAAAASGFRARAAADVPRVVFLDPASPNVAPSGPMARAANDFMALAARQLGIQFEMLHAQHDHLLMIRHAETVAARTNPPDYVMLVNDKLAAPAMLAALDKCTARVFVIHSDVTDEQRSTGNLASGPSGRWASPARARLPRRTSGPAG